MPKSFQRKITKGTTMFNIENGQCCHNNFTENQDGDKECLDCGESTIEVCPLCDGDGILTSDTNELPEIDCPRCESTGVLR